MGNKKCDDENQLKECMRCHGDLIVYYDKHGELTGMGWCRLDKHVASDRMSPTVRVAEGVFHTILSYPGVFLASMASGRGKRRVLDRLKEAGTYVIRTRNKPDGYCYFFRRE